MVRSERLELSHLATHGSEPCASTNSATTALGGKIGSAVFPGSYAQESILLAAQESTTGEWQ